MDEFLVLLQAKLDEAKSKGLINSDIALLQGQLDKLKIQVELDPKAAQKLANDIGKLINQKIAISNINIDTNQAVRNAKQGGQQIGDALNQSVSKEVSKSQNAIENFKKTLSGKWDAYITDIDAFVDKVLHETEEEYRKVKQMQSNDLKNKRKKNKTESEQIGER